MDVPNSANTNLPTGSGTLVTDAAETILNGNTPNRIDIIYSHEHFDHIGGAKSFYDYVRQTFPTASVDVWGTQAVVDLIQRTTANRAVRPTEFIGDSGRLISLGGGLNIEMTISGGHAQQDVLIRIPPSNGEKGVLMFVDIVVPGFVPPIDLALTADVARYISAQREALKLEWDILVGGHFVSGVRRDMELNLEYSEDLIKAAMVGLADAGPEDFGEAGIGRFSNPRAREFGNLWFLFFRVVRKVQVDICYRILLEKWGCRLAGIDITGPGHCLTALGFLANEG